MRRLKYILIFCFFLLAACRKQTGAVTAPDTLITINSNPVSRQEYLIYLEESKKSFEEIGGSDIWETDFDGRTAEDVAKERAFNSVVSVKLVRENADKIGLELSGDEAHRAEADAEGYIARLKDKGGEITPQISEAAAIVYHDRLIFEKFRQEFLKSYEVNEADFEGYYADTKDTYAKDGELVLYKRITVSDEETAERIYDEALLGISFEKLIEDYQNTDEILRDTKKSLGQKYEYDFYSKEEGSLLSLLNPQNEYDIIKIIGFEQKDEAELKSEIYEFYKEYSQQQLFTEYIGQRQAEAEIVRNEKLWDEIKIN